MAPPDLRTFLDRSFEVLAYEAPDASSRLGHALAGLDLCVIDGDRRFAVRHDGSRLLSDAISGDEPVITSIDRATILALVDGVLSLEDAVRQDRLLVRASPPHCARVFDALSSYVRGAVRCPSFPALLADFRSTTPRRYHHGPEIGTP